MDSKAICEFLLDLLPGYALLHLSVETCQQTDIWLFTGLFTNKKT